MASKKYTNTEKLRLVRNAKKGERTMKAARKVKEEVGRKKGKGLTAALTRKLDTAMKKRAAKRRKAPANPKGKAKDR